MKGSARGKRDLKVMEGEGETSTAVGIVGPGGEGQIYHVSLRGGDCLSYQNYRMETEAAQPEEADQYRVTAILISIH